ncbi:UNVERIFIED_CONTAM: hypothetical protein Slati_0710800 [Sesamum latifolium]|uniref:Uncharacterized protein n=1 Tax=Sesamum latifolium TaxID=2727402 RepID=A0AAW2Y5F7_9LAMI
MLDDPANAYFALISQHCIPLHSFNYLYNFLFDLGRLSRDLEFPSYIEILDNEPTLWDRLRKSNSSYSYMFARKFSPDCLNPLMEMADSVIFKD